MARIPTHAEVLTHSAYSTVVDKDNLPSFGWDFFQPMPSIPRPLAFAVESLYRSYAVLDRRKVEETRDYLSRTLSPDTPGIVIDKPSNLSSIPTGTCPDIETNFDRLARQVYATLEITEANGRISVYHDEDGVPLFLRKSRDASSALSLASFQLSGSNLAVPPGTVVGLGRTNPRKVTGQKFVIYPGLYEEPITTVQSILFDNQEDAVQPLRLSAWAFDDPLDRSLFAVSGERIYGTPTNRIEMLCSNDIDRFRKIASGLIELCYQEGSNLVATPPLGELQA